MIVECKNYLKNKLKAAGIKTNIFEEQKKLKNNQEQHTAAVLIEKEEIEKSGKIKVYTDEQTSKRQKRTEKFSRIVYFIVVIGDYDLAACATIYEKFISLLDNGLYINGNFTDMSIEEIDWVDEDDSILKSKITVQMLFKFEGGIFEDTEFKHINLENVTAEVEPNE
jgi:hypothetical protein